MTGGKKRLIKYGGIAGVIALLAVLSFAIIHPALAQQGAQQGSVVGQVVAGAANGIGNIIKIIVGSLLSIYVWFIGNLLLVLIKILVRIASYNDFVNSAVVKNGWTIVRDISNMFFILILLAIAFGTILGVEKLDWKARLPKLLIFAVLINFTRVIAGIVIDFGQVIMITFVNGFKDAAGGNFAELLGIRQLMELSIPTAQQAVAVAQGDIGDVGLDFIQVIGALFGAAIFATISTIVILLLVLVLIYRMVMLWIYVTLSPIAFLLGAFPQGESYYADWWKKLVSTVALGPVLAFFIWLSLLSVQQITIASNTQTDANGQAAAPLSCGASEICQEDNVLKFIIGIGLLMGGLTVAQGFASSAGEGMGGLVGWAKKRSTGAMKELTGMGVAGRAKAAFQKKDMQAGGISGLLARGGVFAQAGLKGVPFLGGAKAGMAVEKYQSDQIALQKKKMGSLSDVDLIKMAKKDTTMLGMKAGGIASYQKAAALALLAEQRPGAITEYDEKTNPNGFKKEEIDAAKNVFGNDKAGYGQFMAAIKKQAPALAYDLKNPAERTQFIADAGRGVARVDNLEAKYFTDELGGKDLVKGLALGKTAEQITAIYNKLTEAAQKQFREQTGKLIAGGTATPDMQQSFADITHDMDAAFPPGMAGSDEGIQRWVDRMKKATVKSKAEAVEVAEARISGAGGSGTAGGGPAAPPTPGGGYVVPSGPVVPPTIPPSVTPGIRDVGAIPVQPKPMTQQEIEEETAKWTGGGGTPPLTPSGPTGGVGPVPPGTIGGPTGGVGPVPAGTPSGRPTGEVAQAGMSGAKEEIERKGRLLQTVQEIKQKYDKMRGPLVSEDLRLAKEMRKFDRNSEEWKVLKNKQVEIDRRLDELTEEEDAETGMV